MNRSLAHRYGFWGWRVSGTAAAEEGGDQGEAGEGEGSGLGNDGGLQGDVVDVEGAGEGDGAGVGGVPGPAIAGVAVDDEVPGGLAGLARGDGIGEGDVDIGIGGDVRKGEGQGEVRGAELDGDGLVEVGNGPARVDDEIEGEDVVVNEIGDLDVGDGPILFNGLAVVLAGGADGEPGAGSAGGAGDFLGVVGAIAAVAEPAINAADVSAGIEIVDEDTGVGARCAEGEDAGENGRGNQVVLLHGASAKGFDETVSICKRF